MKKVRLCIMGLGGIFESHARGLKLNQDKVEIVAVSDAHIHERKIIRACELLSVKRESIHFYSDYEEMISKEQLDAAIILLPHHLHAPAAIYAANHGLHILAEKPMARTTAECDAMLRAAEENHVTLTVCHDRRYNDEWRVLKEIVASGKIGKPIYYRLEHNQNYAPGEGSWIRDAEMLGGGCIMSCLTHQIDALRWIGGELKEVSCMSKVLPNRMEGETIGVISGQMESGALVQMSINWHTVSDVSVNNINPVKNALWFEFVHIVGDKGEAYYLANKGVFLLQYKTPDGMDEYAAGLEGFEPYFQGGNVFGHENIITEWLDMLRGTSDNIVTYGADSRNTIAVAEAAYASVREKRVIPVQTVS